jgi:hypothetical protein
MPHTEFGDDSFNVDPQQRRLWGRIRLDLAGLFVTHLCFAPQADF